ncbi:MAG: hypothetical protein K2H52_07525 [Lachnospiraceae bacterium]|nr:hypothetical protein [Lachnospiraceae bacterium]MDE7285322.1 hypothetical protein [Lachnospiraceae bacterium]
MITYEFLKFLSSGIFAIIVGALGLSYLLVPYEKLKEKNPNLKSPKTIKICGVIMVVGGAIMLVLAVGIFF